MQRDATQSTAHGVSSSNAQKHPTAGQLFLAAAQHELPPEDYAHLRNLLVSVVNGSRNWGAVQRLLENHVRLEARFRQLTSNQLHVGLQLLRQPRAVQQHEGETLNPSPLVRPSPITEADPNLQASC